MNIDTRLSFATSTDRLDVVLPYDATAARVARSEAAQFLGERCAAPLLDDVLIVISELVTNAVNHTGAACALSVELHPAEIVVEVRDADSRPKRKAPNEDGSLGRGLGVVQSLTHRWGIERMPEGKCVWAELAVPDP